MAAEASMAFPFLTDEDTKRYIECSKVLFIMRGLPGSGKSTIVREIQKIYPQSVICSADDHFLQEDGEYKYNKELLPDAHDSCHLKAETACKENTNVVIIDNTNVRKWEMKFYAKLAMDCCYTTVLVTPRTDWCLDYRQLTKRNKHNVDEDTLKQKVATFVKENANPLYWGWFLNKSESDKVLQLAHDYFGLCLKNSPEFLDNFRHLTAKEESVCFSSVHKWVNSSEKCLHCTAFFGGREVTPSVEAYANDPVVVQNIGKSDTLQIIGFIITPRTVGARIKLSADQLKLWRNEKQGNDFVEKMKSLNIQQDKKFLLTSGYGSKAHLTLACAEGVNAVETGIEQTQVIQLEQEHGQDDQFCDVDCGRLRCFDEGRYCLYLENPIDVACLFSGRY